MPVRIASDTAPKSCEPGQRFEPGEVLDEEQIEAAHAATGEGEHPKRGQLAEGWLFAAGLFMVAGALLVIGVHVVARHWQTISRWFA